MSQIKVTNLSYHLVEYKANMNSLNTGNDGTGRLKIRVGDDKELNHIKTKLSEMGMDAHPHVEKHELKQYIIIYSNIIFLILLVITQEWQI